MPVKSGGGTAAIWYSVRKAFAASGGPVRLWRRMASKNACKTCAYGMGGALGGMRNEAGHFPEFCKKSIQAMAADMQPGLPPSFFNHCSIDDLAALTSRELENLGRLAYPVRLRGGQRKFEPIAWDEAYDTIADRLRQISPRRTFFYSSGRSSNEAGFLLQWLGRVYGTNNIHNCSYYCHQASGVGLGQTIGGGTATVTLDDVEHADFVILLGANPASNHPRLISTLARIRKNGGSVVVVNPLREIGLERFRIPSDPVSLFGGTTISDLYIQPRIGGDIAFLKGVLKLVVERDAIDSSFIREHTVGWEDVARQLELCDLDELSRQSGVDVPSIARVAELYCRANRAVFMWAMGITHHEHGVDNVIALANLALSRGMVGRPNAGLMPIRGHSNVQGIGSMGFTPRLQGALLEAMENLYGVTPPEWPGLNSIESVEAAHRGEIDAALFLGGNFYSSNPDLTFAGEALGRIGLSVHISTKLNHGHVVPRPGGGEAQTLILPTLVRDEERQATTQESMFSFVRVSDGGAVPPAGDIRSEVDIITSIGARLLPSGPIDFDALRDHREIRSVIARVVPGYADIDRISETDGEFHVGQRVRHTQRFGFPDGKARFVHVVTPEDPLEPGHLRLMTIRSEGQFNTVVYEEEDRYRNQRSRDVILLNAEDIAALGFEAGERVTVASRAGSMAGVKLVAHNIARRCAAMYYPEANVLVSRRVDARSGTPAFKNVHVWLVRPEGPSEIVGVDRTT